LLITFSLEQASLFPYAALIATETPIYEAFCRFANKFRAFWVPQGRQEPPSPVKDVLLFIEDLLKLRNRAKVNKTTAERIAGEKHRAEKEDALMEVQATKKARPFLSYHLLASAYFYHLRLRRARKARRPRRTPTTANPLSQMWIPTWTTSPFPRY